MAIHLLARCLRGIFWVWFLGGVTLGIAAHVNPTLKGILFDVARHALH